MALSFGSGQAEVPENSEDYGEYFAGIAALLNDVSNLYPPKPGEDPILQHAAEVTSIFDYLDKLPLQYQIDTLRSLCLGRRSLPPDAADLVIRGALQAMASGRFTVEQEHKIVPALLAGIPRDEDRFEREWAEIFGASKDPRQHPETRISLLKGLASNTNAVSSGRKNQIEDAIHHAYHESESALFEANEAEAIVQGSGETRREPR